MKLNPSVSEDANCSFDAISLPNVGDGPDSYSCGEAASATSDCKEFGEVDNQYTARRLRNDRVQMYEDGYNCFLRVRQDRGESN